MSSLVVETRNVQCKSECLPVDAGAAGGVPKGRGIHGGR